MLVVIAPRHHPAGRTALHVLAASVALHVDWAPQVQDADMQGQWVKNAKEFVGRLLRAGCDPCVRDASGRTALDLAQSKGNTPALEAMRALMSAEQLQQCPYR